MKKLNDLEYLKLNGFAKFFYNVKLFFLSTLPLWFMNLGKKVWKIIRSIGLFLFEQVKDIGYTFIKGNWAVKVSFFIFGFGNFFYGQPLRGILFLVFEIVFLVFMFLPDIGGLVWLEKCQFFLSRSAVSSARPLKRRPSWPAV